jgi:folate-dependent phosphoribosylglycinamide formyltransferase PurN
VQRRWLAWPLQKHNNIHPALLPAYRGLSSLSSMQYDGTAADYAGLTLHIALPT